MKIGDGHYEALVRFLKAEREYLVAAGWHEIGEGYWSNGKQARAWSQRDAASAQRTKDRNDLRSMGIEVKP